MRFRLKSDVRKEKEDSWLNALKTKLVKGRLNFSRKTVQQEDSTTAAIVVPSDSCRISFKYLGEEQSYYRRYNILPWQSTCICFFTSFNFQTYFSAMLIVEGAKTPAIKRTRNGIL